MKRTLGIDIGAQSIKVLELSHSGGSTTVLSAGVVSVPRVVFNQNQIQDNIAITNLLGKLVKETGIKADEVTLALPETQVFSRVIQVPKLSKQELASAIKWEAEQYIPMPLDQVNVDYTILGDGKEVKADSMDVLLIAAPKSMIDTYIQFMDSVDLTPVCIETEMLSVYRSVMHTVPNVSNSLILHVGLRYTCIAVLRNGFLSYIHTFAAGTDALARSIAQQLSLDLDQAHKALLMYGFERNKFEGKVAIAAKPILDTVLNEIKRAVGHYNERYKEGTISTVFLCGGGAMIPGYVVTLAEAVGVETQLVNPFSAIKADKRFSSIIEQGTRFVVASGLALRDK